VNIAAVQLSHSLVVLTCASFLFQLILLNSSFPGPVLAAAAETSRGKSEPKISMEEIEAYANAKARADEITAYWAESIEQSSAADVLRQVRESEIEIAIGLEGLSLSRYRELGRLVEKDSKLQGAVKLFTRE